MARNVRSGRPLGKIAWTCRPDQRLAEHDRRAMTDAQGVIDEVARTAPSLHSSVAKFRY
jgi:hypothetical protein